MKRVGVAALQLMLTFVNKIRLAKVQGRGNYFEVGGGGQASPGVQGNPYPKLKNPRIWPTIF